MCFSPFFFTFSLFLTFSFLSFRVYFLPAVREGYLFCFSLLSLFTSSFFHAFIPLHSLCTVGFNPFFLSSKSDGVSGRRTEGDTGRKETDGRSGHLDGRSCFDPCVRIPVTFAVLLFCCFAVVLLLLLLLVMTVMILLTMSKRNTTGRRWINGIAIIIHCIRLLGSAPAI